MVLAFARAMELETADVAVIGDSIHDLETAQRAKAGRRIAVLSGTSGHADLAPHADAVLDSVADVAGLLKAIGHPPARKGR
jgi:phosphoglycolate phosphatase